MASIRRLTYLTRLTPVTCLFIARGDTRTMSFGFSTVKDEWRDANNRAQRSSAARSVCCHWRRCVPATTASVRNLTIIAKRTETDLAELTDAIAALESGTELTEDQADVLQSVVDRSRPHVDIVEPAPAPAVTPLTVLMKQLDLIAKKL
jgi:hypothetical protein